MKNKLFFQDQRITNTDTSKDALFLLRKLQNSGFSAFLVGGCVRDILLSRTVRDWDILTNATIDQITTIFCKQKIFKAGKKYQTVTLVLNRKTFQISSFHKNSNHPYRNNQERLFQQLQNDLICRDFTINAIVWAEDVGIFDPTNGLKDLERKIIRSINPGIRFKEDPLRMLRAIRIACELDFTICEDIKKSIRKHMPLIYFVSKERIRNEMTFILECPDVKKGIRLLQQFGFERYIFNLDKVKKFQETKILKKRFLASGLSHLRGNLAAQLALWGRVYFGSCQSARLYYFTVIKSLRYNNKVFQKVMLLLSKEWEDLDFGSEVKIRFLFANFGKETVELFMMLKKILLSEGNQLENKRFRMEEKLLRNELAKNNPTRIGELQLDGNDLLRMGIPEGKIIGDILGAVFQKVLASPEINQKDVLVKLVQEIVAKKRSE